MAVSAEAKIKITSKDATKKGIATAQKGVGKLTSAVKAYGAELAAMFLAARKVYKVVEDLTQAYIENEKVNAILNATLKATGIYTEDLSNQLKTYATAMQSITTFSRAQILQAQGIAATFTQIGTEIYPEVIERAMDMSAVFGGDLQRSMIQLGKAINDPRMAAGLREIGVTMSEQQMEMIKYMMEIGDLAGAQRIILDELKLEMGGAAKAVGDTFGGQVEIVTNLVHEWKSAIGGLLAEQGGPLLDWIQEFLDLSDENNKNLETVIRILRGVGAAYATTFEFWFNYYGTMVESVQALIDVWKSLGTVIGIVFNPKKWGRGGIEAELAKIKDVVIDTAIDIGKGWEEWVINSQERWAKVFAEDVMPVMEEVTIEAQRMTTAITENAAAITENVEAVKDINDLVTVWSDKMAQLGLDAQFYTSQLRDMTSGTNEIAAATDAVLIPALEDELVILRQLNGAWVDYKRSAELALEAATEMREKIQQTVSDISFGMGAFYDTIGKGASQYYQNQSIELKNWYAERKKAIDANISDEQARADAIAALDEQMAAKESALRTKEAQAQKKMAIFGIITHTAQGIMAALAQYPPRIAKALMIGAMGAVQLGIAQSAAIPTYQEGGIVPGYGGGDTVPVLLEPGEMVIRKEIVREAQQGGEEIPHHVHVYLDGRQIQDFISRSSRSKEITIYKGAIVNTR